MEKSNISKEMSILYTGNLTLLKSFENGNKINAQCKL